MNLCGIWERPLNNCVELSLIFFRRVQKVAIDPYTNVESIQDHIWYTVLSDVINVLPVFCYSRSAISSAAID